MSVRLKRWTLWLVLAMVLLRPTPHRLSSTVAGDLGDSMFLTWTLSWGAHGLVNAPLDVFDANIFHPHANMLALSDPMLSLAPAFGLIEWLSGSAVVALNVLMLGLFVLALAAAHALGKRLFAREDLAILFAVVACCNSFVFGHQNHPQIQTFGLITVCVLALLRAIELRRARDGLMVGAATVALFLANLQFGLIWVVCAVVMIATLWIRRALPPIRDLVRTGTAALLSTAVVMVPVAVIYRRTFDLHGISRSYEPNHSLGLTDLLTPQDANWSWGDRLNSINSSERLGEHSFFVGFTVLVLALLGLVQVARHIRGGGSDTEGNTRPDEMIAIIVAGAVAMILALGPTVLGAPGPFRILHAYVPGFDGVRATSRFAAPGYLGAAVLVTLAVRHLRWSVPPTLRRWAIPLVALLVVVEVGGPMKRVDVPSGDRTLVYETLDRLEGGPVLELPIRSTADGFEWAFVEAPRLYLSTIDFNPRVNGYSGATPLGFDGLAAVLNTYPSAESEAILDELGVRYVVLHTGDEQGFAAYTPGAADEIAGEVSSRGAESARYGEDWLIIR